MMQIIVSRAAELSLRDQCVLFSFQQRQSHIPRPFVGKRNNILKPHSPPLGLEHERFVSEVEYTPAWVGCWRVFCQSRS